MITITNYWGMFFSFVLPIALMICGAYIARKEEIENKFNKRKGE